MANKPKSHAEILKEMHDKGKEDHEKVVPAEKHPDTAALAKAVTETFAQKGKTAEAVDKDELIHALQDIRKEQLPKLLRGVSAVAHKLKLDVAAAVDNGLSSLHDANDVLSSNIGRGAQK